MFKKLITKKGFTLLEILLVVGIIAVLAGIVIIAINPSKQLATVRNTQRKSNLAEINKAVQQYYIDNSTYPGGTSLVSTLTEICNTGAIPATTTSVTGAPCGTLTNLSDLVPTYLVAIPVDPQGSPIALLTNIAHADTLGTGYEIMKDANNKIALNSQGAELGAVITLGPVVIAPAATNPVYVSSVSGNFLDNEDLTVNISNIISTSTYWYSWYRNNSGTASATSLITNGLLAYYPLNNDTLDYSGNNNDGTNSGAIINSIGGKVGNGGVFNGVNSIILSQNTLGIDLTQPLSVCNWFKSVNDNNPKVIWSYGYDGAGYNPEGIMLQGTTLGMYLGGVGFIGSTVTINPSDWNYICYTYDGSVNRFYVNNNNPITDTSYIELGNTIFAIGAWYYPPNSSAYFFDGSIDEVMIFNRAISPTEVKQLYEGSRLGGNKLGADQTTAGDTWKVDVNSNGIGGNNWTSVGSSTPVTIVP